MSFNEVSLVGMLVGGLFIFIALRIILKRNLVFHFLWSVVALGFLSIGLLVLIGGFDLIGYRRILAEEPVATLSFERIAPREYRVDIVDNEGNHELRQLRGDQWQLDVRLIRWSDSLSALGIKPMYRLDRISGRFDSIREELAHDKSAHSLNSGASYVLDVWSLARRFPQLRSMMDTQYGSATYLPMADAASFRVFVNSAGLVARPANDTARLLVTDWD